MKNCIFCNPEIKLTENEFVYARLDGFPVSHGHILIIPKRHVKTFFELTEEEVKAMYSLLTEIKFYIDNIYKPDGYNIGFNIGEAAGQTVEHCHLHVIPRYEGDVENPKGGIRGVIPKNKEYIIPENKKLFYMANE